LLSRLRAVRVSVHRKYREFDVERVEDRLDRTQYKRCFDNYPLELNTGYRGLQLAGENKLGDDYESRIARGKIGEDDLLNWFNKHGLLFVAVNQSIDSFSSAFRDVVKRPDFFILIEGKGMMAVDAKNLSLSGNAYTLALDTGLNRTLAFENLFNVPVWYAFRESSDLWYWIRASDVKNSSSLHTNSETGDRFLSITRSRMHLVTSKQNLLQCLS